MARAFYVEGGRRDTKGSLEELSSTRFGRASTRFRGSLGARRKIAFRTRLF